MAHATEGVWGLCCDPFSVVAVANLVRVKPRDLTKGFVIIAAAGSEFAAELDSLDHAHKVTASWPGRITWVLPNRQFPAWVTGKSEQVAARVPDHPQSRALCEAFGGPLISTSANPPGYPPARNPLQVRRYFHRHKLFILPGKRGLAEGPSTIIDAASGKVVRS